MTVMGSDTEHLPDEITYGFVADRVLLAIGDTTGDDDRFPDGVPAKGTVRFSPERTILYTQETPATVLPQDIECTIYHRDHPVAVNNGYEPELVGKLVDPAGHVGNVALIVGWYEAVYRLETGTAQRFRFKVLPEHTADNPLWLPSVAPLTPTPSERFVVNEQVYNDTKQARDEAVGAAVTAVEARTGAETARDQAGTHATASAASASTAADILAATQALGITVDTSVGTRVYVGDVMIHGDTGWRDVIDLTDPLVAVADGVSVPHTYISRINNQVFLSLRLKIAPEIIGADRNSWYRLFDNTVPYGFRITPTTYAPVYSGPMLNTGSTFVSDKSDFFLSTISGASTLTLRGKDGVWDERDILSFSTSWTTSDNWPSSLPGTPL